jgi:hypothetical protein
MASNRPNDYELETYLLFIITNVLIKPISIIVASKDVLNLIPLYLLMLKSYKELSL